MLILVNILHLTLLKLFYHLHFVFLSLWCLQIVYPGRLSAERSDTTLLSVFDTSFPSLPTSVVTRSLHPFTARWRGVWYPQALH